MYTKTTKIEDRLLATHLADNADFETACFSGDKEKILSIIDFEMEKNNLHTAGSKKLRSDIFKILNSRKPIIDVLYFVWNSRLSGTGDAVIA